MTKKIAVTGDWHHGSRFGLATREYVSEHNLKRSDCLMLREDFMQRRDEIGKIDWLFLMGDLADGFNPSEHGEDIIAEESSQIRMAQEFIRSFRGSPKIIALRGSRYHRGRGGPHLDERIAENVGAIPDKRGRYASPARLKDIEGVRFSLAHKITVSKSSWQYRTTPIAVRLVLSRLNKLEDSKPYILIRGHCHTFSYAGFKTQMGVTCPCYSTESTFAESEMPEVPSDIGMLYFEVNDTSFDWRPLVRSVAIRVE